MSIKISFIVVGAFFFSFIFFFDCIYPAPKVGDMAPDFTLSDQNDHSHTLSALRGNKVALCFYPADNTPGCTKEMCKLRDGWTDLEKAGIKVFGISFDSNKSHKKFASKHKFSFPILSDSKKKVGKAYGTKMLGFLPFSKRITFLIDEKGIIAHIIKDVNTKNHAQQIINTWK